MADGMAPRQPQSEVSYSEIPKNLEKALSFQGNIFLVCE